MTKEGVANAFLAQYSTCSWMLPPETFKLQEQISNFTEFSIEMESQNNGKPTPKGQPSEDGH